MPRRDTRWILYTAHPLGIDQHWKTSLEVYCYLYHHPDERARLQSMADKEEVRSRHNSLKETPQLFHVWHKGAKLELRIRARTADKVLMTHLHYLLAQEGIDEPNPEQSKGA